MALVPEQLCGNGCGETRLPGYSLCGDCSDRLWRELYWLADLYDHLFQALTHRLNVEKAEQVVVHGGKDPLVRGLDLHEEAVTLRARVRAVGRFGVDWAKRRGLPCPVPDTQPSNRLRWLARNLHWLLTDLNPEWVSYWGSKVVDLRQEAEVLVTPQAEQARKTQVQGRSCAVAVEALDGTPVLCGGGIWVWTGDLGTGVCDQNPGHLVSRETLVKERAKVVHQANTKALLRKILGVTPTTRLDKGST